MLSGHARAEVTIAKPGDGWEVYTAGRVGGFVELLDGNGLPLATSTKQSGADGRTLSAGNGGEGIAVNASPDPNQPLPNTAGHAFASRVRSGFLGNIMSLGVRHPLTDSTKVTGQVSLWSTTETDALRAYNKDQADVREAYLKIEGPGGSLLVGRALSLFGRGATEIDFLYGHGYAVGAPLGFADSGPSGGHIGFGIISNIFAGGVAYATPKFNGLQLTVGYYDPVVLVGVEYERTKLGRPETEATYDAEFAPGFKLHVFADGAFQKLYDTNGTDSSKTVYGVAAGARADLGPFHVGVSAYTGKGLGVTYFLNQVDSILNKATNNLRTFDGGYVQTQTQVGQFDFNVGAGITRAHQMTDDLDPQYPNQEIYLKSQMGISGVIVYHFSQYLHGALDYFRADSKWWLGEEQVINSFNVGMTLTW
jgi:hypothetical protein